MLMMLQSMSEFNGVWKHQNNPACTTGVIVFIILKLYYIQWITETPKLPSMHKSFSLHNVETGHYSVDYGNTRITQHALPVSVIIMLKLDTI